MDFAGSSILCQFSSSDSATVLRWFCDSSSVQYIRSCIVLRWFYDSLSVQYVRFRKSVTVLNWFCDSSSVQYIRFRDPALCFAGSTILCQFSTLDPAFQSCKCASPILRFCVGSTSETVLRFRSSANSSILSWLRESCCGFR